PGRVPGGADPPGRGRALRPRGRRGDREDGGAVPLAAPAGAPRAAGRAPEAGGRGRMTCRDIHGLAANYVDGELPEETSNRVQRHLLQCSPCREEVESLRTAVEVLRATHGGAAVSQVFVEAVLARLEGELGIQNSPAEVSGQLILLHGAG